MGLRKPKKTGNSTAACTITIWFEPGFWYCVPKPVRQSRLALSIGLGGVKLEPSAIASTSTLMLLHEKIVTRPLQIASLNFLRATCCVVVLRGGAGSVARAAWNCPV